MVVELVAVVEAVMLSVTDEDVVTLNVAVDEVVRDDDVEVDGLVLAD